MKRNGCLRQEGVHAAGSLRIYPCRGEALGPWKERNVRSAATKLAYIQIFLVIFWVPVFFVQILIFVLHLPDYEAAEYYQN